MAQQTAVDFLYEFVQMKLTNEQQMQFEGLFQQAKQMEKEQIMMAHCHNRCLNNKTYECSIKAFENSEQYYNETFKCDCGEESKPPTKIGQTCVVPDCKKEAIQGAFHRLCSQHIWPNG